MRVLWISHSARLGGAELALHDGATALAARGHDVHVVLPETGPLAARLAGPATVHICQHKPWMVYRRTARNSVGWPGYNVLVATPQLVRLIRAVAPDVALSNTLLTMAGAGAVAVARVPHAWYAHEFGVEDHGLRFTLGERFTRAVMRASARACLTPSEATSVKFADWLGIPALVAPCPVAIRAGDRTPRPAGGPLRLVLVGSKKPSKGQMDAVEAMIQLAGDGVDAELTLVGADEGSEPELRRAASAGGVGDRVRFLAPQPDAVGIMRDSDVVLMCSRMEAFGRVTLEALEAGRPVVGAAAGATPELVHHGENGYLYEPGDSHDLARWLTVCARDRDALEVMGARGQSWANEQFSLERCGARLEAALWSVVHPPEHPAPTPSR